MLVFTVLIADGGEEGSVAAIDPVSGTTEASYRTGYDPAAAVSPTGDRVYVASSVDTSSYLSVIETASGRVVDQLPFPDRWMGTLPAYFPVIATAPGGRWVYALKAQSIAPERDVYSL